MENPWESKAKNATISGLAVRRSMAGVNGYFTKSNNGVCFSHLPRFHPPQKRMMKRWLFLASKSAIIGVAAFTGLLFIFQEKMIWFPRPYGAAYKMEVPKNAAELRYTTSQGEQCAFYIPPHGASPMSSTGPERVWVCFCGNGSLALDWTDFINGDPDKHDGFLLVDYPGYGNCKGKPTPACIDESADQAVAALAARLDMKPAELESRLCTLGHSIGAGIALRFATRHAVQQLIVFAPFTSLRDMARRQVGWPLCWMLRHNIDNRASMRAIAARATPPRVTIFHGADDQFIPPEMGSELASMFPKIATFHKVTDAGHDTIVYAAASQAYEVMNGK